MHVKFNEVIANSTFATEKKKYSALLVRTQTVLEMMLRNAYIYRLLSNCGGDWKKINAVDLISYHSFKPQQKRF